MRDDRPAYSGRPPDRQGFQGPRPFRPAPRTDTGPAPFVHTLRVREGDREIEVSGSAVFVRQVLDDLNGVWGRLRGEPAAGPASIRMPDPPAPDEEPASIPD